MAAPNLAASTVSLYKESIQALLTSTLTTDIIGAVATDDVLEIKGIYITNIDGTNDAVVTLGIIKSGGAVILLLDEVAVKGKTTLTLDTPIYLQEGDILEGGTASASDANITVSYNRWSD